MGTVKCDSSTQYDVTFFCPSVPLRQPSSLKSTTVLMPTRLPSHSSSISSRRDGKGSSGSSRNGSGSIEQGPCGVLPGDSCCSRLGEQCGGVRWHGATCCRNGASCFRWGPTYSECRLSASHPEVDVVVTE